MQNIDSEIVKSPKASAFTLIVAFVCVALVGLALIPLLPVKLNPSRTLPGFTVRFSMPGTSARVVEMTATCPCEGYSRDFFHFRKRMGKCQCEFG
jgi:predicted Na+-dependent transporter